MRVGWLVLLVAIGGCRVVGSPDLVFHCNSSGKCPQGLQCCPDQFCRANCDAFLSCDGGSTCDSNPGAPCMVGRPRCDSATGGASCVDATAALDGTLCGAGQVCRSGQCEPCVNGASCRTNPTACLLGALECQPTPACRDTQVQLPPGEACGVDRVCSPGAVCTPCAAGSACTDNTGLCRLGVWSCTSGEPTCVDGALAPQGTRCGPGKMCDLAGACVDCVQGQSCQGNPTACRNGALDCAATPARCADAAGNRDAGTSCGTNQVCSAAGACVACTPGERCDRNPTPCRLGIRTCASGTPECADTSAQAPPGSSCGTNQVCSASGACVPCTEGELCSGNQNVCKRGTTRCGSGTPQCVDGALNADAGTPCDGGQTCNSGFCGNCVQGQSCTGNPTPCRNGSYDCTLPSPECVDAPGNRAAGTPCGVNHVCDSVGACVSCTASQPCGTNSNPCKVGVTSCATGSQTCIDSVANAGLGALCDGGFCNGDGGCVACALNTGCNTNPGTPCRTGIFARSESTCACIDFGVATEPLTCRTTVESFGACTWLTCKRVGSRTRTVTTYTCGNGDCNATSSSTTDTSGCDRGSTTNQVCGNRSCPATWPACTYVNPECSNTGTRFRTCSTPICNANEACTGVRYDDEPDHTACNRNQDNQLCGARRTCDPPPDCANAPYTGHCDSAATMVRQCIDRTCGGGSCQERPQTEETICTRTTLRNPCPGGRCATGDVCCPGCLNAQGGCENGDTDTACGFGGINCEPCPGIFECVNGNCCDPRGGGC